MATGYPGKQKTSEPAAVDKSSSLKKPSKSEPKRRRKRRRSLESLGEPRESEEPERELSDKNRKLLHEAMKEGHVNARTAKVLIHGIAGSGKTSTKHVIFDEKPPKIRRSTPLAERPIKAVRVDAKSSKWSKIGPKEMQALLAKAMVSYASSRKHLRPGSYPHLGIHPKTRPSTLQGTREPASSPRHTPQLPEAVLRTEDELVQLMGQVSGSNFVLELDFIHFIDSGGQPQFLEVLPIFLRGTAIYMVVTNLSEMFDQYPMVKYYESGNLVCKPYPAAHTNEEILQQCVTTMQSQGSQAAGGNPPKIMIIGTHSDKEHECKETREAKNEKLLKMLLPAFQKEIIYSSRDMKQLIFALNAKTPGEAEYKIADAIRREIMKCFPQPDEIPLRWYALELLLKEMAESQGRYVLSIGECFIVAQRLHFDEESFKAALEYLDKLNILYYYPKILPNVVFCDPQVLLDKLTELVKFSYELKGGSDPNETKAYDGQHQRFRDHGLVTSRFLEAFDKHYIPELFTAEDLIRLFKDLLILADFEESTYFMPCVLEVLSSEKVAKYRLTTSSAATPLAIHFPSGPRSGVFCLLMTFLQSSDNHFPRPWELWLDGNTPSCLYRNCVEFVIPRFAGSIVLINSFAFFEIYIRSARPESVPQLCTFIQKAVFAGLNKATATLHYVEMKPEAALVCPCGKGDVHPAILGDGPSFWICTNNQHTSDALTEKQLLWFSPTSTTSGATSSQSSGLIDLGAPPTKVQRLETGIAAHEPRDSGESPESKTIRTNLTKITQILSSVVRPMWFAQKLEEEALMDDATSRLVLGMSDPDNIAVMMNAVKAQIKTVQRPVEVFTKFIRILYSQPALLDLLQQLLEEYGKNGGNADVLQLGSKRRTCA